MASFSNFPITRTFSNYELKISRGKTDVSPFGVSRRTPATNCLFNLDRETDLMPFRILGSSPEPRANKILPLS